MPADSNLDFNGVPVNVGDTVKLTGTVTAVNLLDNRYHDIVISLAHPLPTSAFTGPPVGGNGGEGADFNPPGARITISVPAAMLTH